MPRKKNQAKGERLKTSIQVDPRMWRVFAGECRRLGIDYGLGVDIVLKDYLVSKTGIANLQEKMREAPGPLVGRDELHKMLDLIIDAGVHWAYAIYVNLELVYDAVRRNQDLTPDEVRRLRQIEEELEFKAAHRNRFKKAREIKD